MNSLEIKSKNYQNRDKLDIPNTHGRDRSRSWVGIGTSITMRHLNDLLHPIHEQDLIKLIF
jgi:hypothetical protein